MVFLDSNHAHDHVLKELEAYAELTSIGSYCVVFDTLIEDVDDKYNLNKPWQIGDNPKTAVHEFLKKSKVKDTNNVAKFQIDKTIQDKLLITVAPDGFLRRVHNGSLCLTKNSLQIFYHLNHYHFIFPYVIQLINELKHS